MTSFKYKMYQTDQSNIDHQINVARVVYNHCISLKKRYYRRFKKSISTNRLQKHLVKLKNRKRYAFFGELNSQSVQDITQRIEKGYKAFFSHQNKRLPDFRKFKDYHSITFKQTGYKYDGGNRIKVMGKTFGFFLSRPVEGRIKTVTVKRDGLGDHYVCFVTDLVRKKSEPATRHGCGFDFGLKTFLTSSEGERIESPLFLKRSLKELKDASKKLSRTVKGSKRRTRARLAVARIHRKVKNQRLDFMFKLTKGLVEKYDELYFEDLSMVGMRKLWGFKVSDIANGEFMRVLGYRCSEYGRKLVKIDRFEPTSQLCHVCGYRNRGLTLSDRSWICPQCGVNHDRDENAAKNIYKSGRALSDSLGDVRPVLVKQEPAVSV